MFTLLLALLSPAKAQEPPPLSPAEAEVGCILDAPAETLSVTWSLDGADPLAVLLQTALEPSLGDPLTTYVIEVGWSLGENAGAWTLPVPDGSGPSSVEVAVVLAADLLTLAPAGHPIPLTVEVRAEAAGMGVARSFGPQLTIWLDSDGSVLDAWLGQEIIDQGGLDPETGEPGPVDPLLIDGEVVVLTAIAEEG
jgi:hypothetical protein